MKLRNKLFAGDRVRGARERRGWTLATTARQLGVSISYLSQIETNQRPLTGRVLAAIVETFELALDELNVGNDERRLADLREACATTDLATEPPPLSELRRVASTAPRFAHHFLDLHRAYREADERLKLADQAVTLDQPSHTAPPLPYEEVRDFFHYRDNYLHELDVEAEALAQEIGVGAGTHGRLRDYVRQRLGLRVESVADPSLVWRLDRHAAVLWVNASQPPETQTFQIAAQLTGELLKPVMERILDQSGLRHPQAVDVCRIGLKNYAAGALLMPYARFAQAAREERHDVERLAHLFGASFEQVCHRLSNLQRPGARGVPFYFLRMDRAGNITKRHSATRFHFARFGGTCPLWNVHDALATPDQFLVQVAEMPDGDRYLSVARSILKPAGAFRGPARRYVLGFGCELRHARHLVYADAVDLKGAPTPIGVSCRICPRRDCAQRAFPPLDQAIRVSLTERAVVPFSIGSSDAD